MTKTLKCTLFGIIILHFCLATQFELSHDESYYWLFSKNLDWGFFDHPPFVAVLIRIFSFLPHGELAVRAGFILLQALSVTILLKMIKPERHWNALLLFFAFPLASFSGLLALPDLPLLFMTVLYCFCLKQYLEKSDTRSIIGLSLVIPVLLYAKYHGILLIFFTILAVPKILLRKDFYIITFISLILFLPHMKWQYDHDFATLRYHFLERPKADFQIKRLFEYLAAQIFLPGLFVGPVVWWTVFKHKAKDDFERALKFISIGVVLFFFISTFSKKFEANWTIFLTMPLILLTLEHSLWDKKILLRTLIGCSVLVIFFRLFFLSTSVKRLNEFHGWKKWAQDISSKCEDPLLANTYQVASKLSFYLQRPVHALNYHSRKNQFDFWKPDSSYYLTSKVCYVTDKREFGGEEILNPEGKKMRLIRDFNPAGILRNNP
jgi:4-amino-4-deoxy-L-arabinose transferase-like glycosyltransferase